MVYYDNFTIETEGRCKAYNITENVSKIIGNAEIKNGHVIICITGTTAAISTMEVEAELDKDINEALEVIAPEGKEYFHDKKWQDHNGYSHIRSTLIGTSVSLPIINSGLVLGSWQQIVLLDFDNKKRDRLITVSIVGE